MNPITLLLAIPVASYGATAIVVGYRYWRELPQRDVDEEVRIVALSNPLYQLLAPVVRWLVRPAWGIVHGLLWPRTLWPYGKKRR